MPIEVAQGILNLTASFDGLQRDLERQIRGVDTRRAGNSAGDDYTAGFGSGIKKIAGVAAAAFAGIAIGDFAKDAVAQASDLTEASTKLQAVFGDGTQAINDFANKGAKALGQSNLAIKDAAATFGVFGKAAGLAGEANATFSTDLVSLSTDLASFYNEDPAAVVEALGAGLRGEAEPLRRFGILMDDATLRAKAMELGLTTTTKDALQPQQKVLAAQALIMEQSAIAQGDFARTSGGLANQQRILAAQFTDMKGKLGAAFLPGVTAVVSGLNEKLFPALESIGSKATAAWTLLNTGDFVGGLGVEEDSPLVGALLLASDTFNNVKGTLQEAWGILANGDFTGVGPFEEDSGFVDFLFDIRDAFGEIAGTLGGVFMDAWSQIGPVFKQVGDVLGPVVLQVFETLKPAIAELLPVFTELLPLFNPFTLVFKSLLPILPQVAELFGALATTVADTLAEAMKSVGPLVESLVGIFNEFMPIIADLVAQLLPPLLELFKSFLPILPPIAETVGELATLLADALGDALKALAPLFQTVVGVIAKLMPFIGSLVEKLMPVFVKLFDSLAPALTKVLDVLVPLIGQIADFLIPIIERLLPVVERVFTYFADTLTNLITIFQNVIEFVGNVFAGDWSAAWDNIKNIFGAIWDQIKNVFSTIWDTIVGLFQALGPAIGDLLLALGDKLLEWGGELLTWLWEGMKDVFNDILDWFGKIAGWAWEKVSSLASDIWQYGVDFITWIKDGIVEGAKALWDWFLHLPEYIWNAITSFAGAAGGWVIDRGIEFIGWLAKGIEDGAMAIWNFIIGLPAKAWGFLVNLKDSVVKIGSDFAQWIVDGIKGAAKAIADAVTGLFSLTLNEEGTGYVTANPLAGGARGAVVPGRDPGRRDNVLGRLPNGVGFGLRSEEAIMVPEFTRSVGGVTGVTRLNRLAEQGMLNMGFARGGVIDEAKLLGALATERIAASIKSDGSGGMFDFIGDDVRKSASGVLGSLLGGGVDSGSARGRFLAAVASKMGTSYVWGAAGPNVFDCSGLVSWALEQAGVGKGRLTAEGFNSSFPRAGEAPGNLVTFDTGRLPGMAGHIGVISDVARGLMMHTDGAGPARISDYRSRDGGPLNIVDAIGGSTGAGVGAAFKGILSKVSGLLVGNLNNAIGPSPDGAGTARWRPMMAQALAAVGRYLGMDLSSYTDEMELQMQSESGGDPNAQNNYDINAQRGYPSQGLLQVIQPTFERALRGTPFENLIGRGPKDPWANLVASALYGAGPTGPYHSLARAYRGVAYANGGIVPGLPAWGEDSVYGALTPGEGVFTAPQTNAIITHAKALEAGFSGVMGKQQINLYLNASDSLQVAVGDMIQDAFDQGEFELQVIGSQTP